VPPEETFEVARSKLSLLSREEKKGEEGGLGEENFKWVWQGYAREPEKFREQ